MNLPANVARTSLAEEGSVKHNPSHSTSSYIFLEISITYEPDINHIFLTIVNENEDTISVEPLQRAPGFKWKSKRIIAWPGNIDKVLIVLFTEEDNSKIENLGSVSLIHDDLRQTLQSGTGDATYSIVVGSGVSKTQIIVSKVEISLNILEAVDDPTTETQEFLLLEMDRETNDTTQISPDAYSNSAALFLRRFEGTNNRTDINNAILLYEFAIPLLESTPQYSKCVYNAGIAYLERFDLLGDLYDIDAAILNFQEAMTAADSKDTELHIIFGDLANAYFYRFERLGKSEDIHDAVANHRRALGLISEEHRYYVRRINNLGVSLQRRFQHSGDIKHLEEGMGLQKKAVELTSHNEPHLLARRLNNLVALYQSHFEATGDQKDLDEAIPLQQKAIDLVEDTNTNKATYLSNLGNVLRRKFDLLGQMEDINWAIEVQQKAVDLSDSHNDSYTNYLNNLSNCILCRYDRLGNAEDLADGIMMQRKAVELKAHKQADYARHKGSLGGSLIRWYEYTGKLEDIDEAVTILREAVRSAGDGKSLEYADYLANLGTALQCRFEHTFHLKDIEEAISVLQQALSLITEGTANYVSHLESLGRAYQDRFERTGSTRDLDEAISLQERAVELTPESSPSLPAYLGNLGNTIWCRILRKDDPEVIDRAIKVHQRAVDLTPDRHPDLPNHLHNLGNSLRHRCEHGGTIEDVEFAIGIQKRAITLTSDDSVELSRRLETLGLMFRCRLDRTNADEDIEEAISIFRKVIQLTPEQHLSRWSKFHALAALLGRRFLGGGKKEDIEEAISCYRSAALSATGLPLNRIKSARNWAKIYLAYIGEEPKHMLEAYDLAFQLLPQTVWLGYTIQGRHEQLRDIADLSNEAAAVAISCGEYEKGLQWLEQGRCIVWSQLSSLRHPVDSLRDKEPELAEDLLRVSMQLQAASSRVEDEKITSNMMQKISVQAQVREHQNLAEEWQSLLDRTRSISEFKSFLQPFTLSNHNLNELPGPVVAINVHLMGCDALVLDNKKPHLSHISLPEFSLDKAHNLLKILNETFVSHNVRVRDSRGGRVFRSKSSPKGMKIILQDLWNTLVKPILKELGLMKPNTTGKKHRIWWCPTGPLTFLPLHAAGLYEISGGPTCSDFVVSSYIPNISAIFDKLGRHTGSPKRMLAIGQRKAAAFPTLSELPNVVKEVEVIRHIFDKSHMQAKILIEDEVTVSSVLDIMSEYHWIHLACHASQEQNPPTKSGFYLNDGQLTLGELIQKSLPQAEFAFLSACQTSTGDRQLSEEAVHLAAGMLAAGYSGVVATMWSISDEYAPIVAREVYSYLLDEKNKVNSYDGNVSAAEALHHAVKRVRDEYGDDEMALLSWVPYIHMGL